MAQKTLNGMTTTTCEECGKTYTGRGRTKKQYSDYKEVLRSQGWYAKKIKNEKLLIERYGKENSWVHFCKDCKDKLMKENIL